MTLQLTEDQIREVIRIRLANRRSTVGWQYRLRQAVTARLRKEMRDQRKKEAAQ